MLFKLVSAAVFIIVMVAFSRLVAKPVAENYGIFGVAVGLAIIFAIGFWIESRDKRKRQEAEEVERVAAVHAEIAQLHSDLMDSMSAPTAPTGDVIEGEYRVVNPGRRGRA